MSDGLDPGLKKIAQGAAENSTCSRTKVGAVLVVGSNIAIGWNEERGGQYCPKDCPRSSSELPHGAPFEGAGSCISRHAEMSAVENFYDAFHGGVRKGLMMVTHKPCEDCQRKLNTLEIEVHWEKD